MLKTEFLHLINNYSDDVFLKEKLWNEIEENYSSKKRFYHNLTHLENVLIQLTDIKTEIRNWDCVLFSLFYHDIIYDVQNSDNEEKSADLAIKRMQQIQVSSELIQNCKNQILATKSHQTSLEKDTNYFTDADLSILGSNWVDYERYSVNVRKEYSIYPDDMYKQGREKVLNHFLKMKSIYKTDYFFDKFNRQALKNIQKELDSLGIS